MAQRQHARKAVRLLKRRPPKGLVHSDADIVRIATDLALGLEEGNLPPGWLDSLYEEDETSSKQRVKRRPPRSSSPSQSEQETEDSYTTEEIVDLSSSTDVTSPLMDDRNSNSPLELKTSKLMRTKMLSVGLLMRSKGNQNAAVVGERPSSSAVTTPGSSSPSLELPLITAHFRRSFTPSPVRPQRIHVPSTPLGLRSKKNFCGKQQSGKRFEHKGRRRKCFEEKGHEMENAEIFSEYWEIPFDPFRDSVLTDHKIFKVENAELEDEEDATLNKSEILANTDYWEIQRIMRFVRIGNPTATVLALCALKELDLQKPSCNEIIRQLHGVSLFLNILATDNRRCRVAALKVMVRLVSSPRTSNIVLKRNGIQPLILILTEEDNVVVSLACEVLSLLTKHGNARVVANKRNIVDKLMSVFKACVKPTLNGDNPELCRSVCNALWSCCQSVREKDAKKISESLNDISRLLETQDEALVVPLLGIVEECASVDFFRGKLKKEKLIEKVMTKMKCSERIKVLCVKILFKCARDERSRKTLLNPSNLQQLMKLFKQNCQGTNDELLTLLLGLIWRCSLKTEHRKRIENHGVFSLVCSILKSDKSSQVKSVTLGVLSELLWEEIYMDSADGHEVIKLLIDFISLTDPAILVTSARSLGVCARRKACRQRILQLDGLRLLWSLLKSPDKEVVASGAVAVASVCACPEESANAVRSIVGGVELLMTLLAGTELTDYKVLICLCEAAVSIAKDAENRSILIDYDLISVLLRLRETKSKMLRYYVTCLISRCCETANERSVLSQCIPYLVEGIDDEFDDHVHCASICTLNELSRDHSKCLFLSEDNTTKILKNLLASSDESIQEAAAGCLSNVRKSMMQASFG